MDNMKKKVIWGAGIYGGRFASGFDISEIAFFIDQDEKRDGELFCGKKIRHPSKIGDKEWRDLFVYVPENYEKEITIILDTKGLKCGEDYCTYGHTLYVSKDRAKQEFLKYKKELELVKRDGMVPIFATYWRKHGYKNFLKHLSETEEEYLLISETAGGFDEGVARGIDCIQAPVFADYETIIDCDDEVCASDEINWLVEEETKHMHGLFPDESVEKCRYSVWMKYKFADYTVKMLKCDRILCFSSVTVENRIIQILSEKYRIKSVFTHPGVIHGTLSFDVNGEVGESIPALYPHGFQKLSVTNDECVFAQKVREYLISSRLNRKVQPVSFSLNSIRKTYENAPTILFAGQNDAGSHMIPYTERTKEHFSPVFSTTLDAVCYVADLCKMNRWNLIYKPHPMYIHDNEIEKLPDNVIYVERADINQMIDFSDVVVTILSTTAYDATVRRKPVVTLGYMQSKGKGINYEAFRKEEIEGVIKEALEKGYTDEMDRNFIKHMAQLLKYYLYDNGEEREIRYGQPFTDRFDDFWKLERMMIEYDDRG